MREIVKSDWITYIPKAFGEREQYERFRMGELAEDPKPIMLELHSLSDEEYGRFSGKVTMQRKRDGVVSFPNQRAVNKQILAENVRSICNYRVRLVKADGVAAQVIDITNGKLLAEHGESELVDEILGVLNDYSALSEGELGNLQTRCAGIRRPTAPSSGTATNVSSSDGT